MDWNDLLEKSKNQYISTFWGFMSLYSVLSLVLILLTTGMIAQSEAAISIARYEQELQLPYIETVLGAQSEVPSSTTLLTGLVYEDLNANGARDIAEKSVPNATIQLDTRSQTTNSKGFYAFSDIPAGYYTITIIPPETYQVLSGSVVKIQLFNSSSVNFSVVKKKPY